MSPPGPGAIVTAVREAVLGEYRQDSCIAATRVTIEVCRYFGIAARPEPVRVSAWTPAAWANREALAGVPLGQWPPDAWAVGITGGEHKPGRWNGHLVAVAGEWLLDASLDQLSRPARGLTLRAAAFTLPDGWDRTEPDTMHIAESSGAVILYAPLGDDAWRRSPNWANGGQGIRRVAGAAIRALIR